VQWLAPSGMDDNVVDAPKEFIRRGFVRSFKGSTLLDSGGCLPASISFCFSLEVLGHSYLG
jgi:hypothetical protein